MNIFHKIKRLTGRKILIKYVSHQSIKKKKKKKKKTIFINEIVNHSKFWTQENVTET